MFHIDRYIQFSTLLGRTVKRHAKELLSAYCVALFITFLMAYLLHYAESPQDPNMNLPNSLYLSVCTLLTIGYGDETPKTFEGRMIVTLLSFFGVTMASLPAVILGSALAMSLKKKTKNDTDQAIHQATCIFLQRLIRYQRAMRRRYVVVKYEKIHENDNTKTVLLETRRFGLVKLEAANISHVKQYPIASQWHHRLHNTKMLITPASNIGIDQSNNDYCNMVATLAATFIYKVSMLVGLRKFKIKNGSLKEEDEMKFLVTAVKNLSSNLETLHKERKSVKRESQEIDLMLGKLTGEISQVKQIVFELSKIKSESDHLKSDI